MAMSGPPNTYCERCEYNLTDTGLLTRENVGQKMICPRCSEPHIITRDWRHTLNETGVCVTAYAAD